MSIKKKIDIVVKRETKRMKGKKKKVARTQHESFKIDESRHIF